MSVNERDWQHWHDTWTMPAVSQPAEPVVQRWIGWARRRLFVTWMIETAVGAGSLGLIAIALRHAANQLEAALGISVGAIIALVWARSIMIRRDEHASDAQSSVEYLAAIRRVRARQLRLAWFIWVGLTLELVFLIPWWVIGSRVHSRSITDIASWLTVWLPVAGFIALYAWSLRLGRRARREMDGIDHLAEQYQEDGDGDAPDPATRAE